MYIFVHLRSQINTHTNYTRTDGKIQFQTQLEFMNYVSDIHIHIRYPTEKKEKNNQKMS